MSIQRRKVSTKIIEEFSYNFTDIPVAIKEIITTSGKNKESKFQFKTVEKEFYPVIYLDPEEITDDIYLMDFSAAWKILLEKSLSPEEVLGLEEIDYSKILRCGINSDHYIYRWEDRWIPLNRPITFHLFREEGDSFWTKQIIQHIENDVVSNVVYVRVVEEDIFQEGPTPLYFTVKFTEKGFEKFISKVDKFWDAGWRLMQEDCDLLGLRQFNQYRCD